MHFPPELLKYLRTNSHVYWPGVGTIWVRRQAASLSESGAYLQAPSLMIERTQIGNARDTSGQEFLNTHPEVLIWMHQQASSLNQALLENSSIVLSDFLKKSNGLPVMHYRIRKKEATRAIRLKKNYRRPAILFVIALFAILGWFQEPLTQGIQANLGFNQTDLPDFKKALEVESVKSISEVSNEPYFLKNKGSSTAYVLVSGVFSKTANAEKWMVHLESKGLEAAMIPGPNGLIRVCSLPLSTDFEAVQLMDEWQKINGVSSWVLSLPQKKLDK